MWVLCAFLSAVFIAATDPISKRLLRHCDEYLVGWLMIFATVPFLGVFAFSNTMAPLGPALLKTLVFLMPIEILVTVLYYRALRLTDISLSVPFLALTPIFVIVTSFLFLGERVRPIGVIGIVLITIGVYSLNIKETKHGLLHPIKAIFTNKGSLCMVAVAVLFSITSTVSKRAMLQSSPASIPFIYNTSIALSMAPLVMYRIISRRSAIQAGMSPGRLVMAFVALGLLSALSSIFYFKSISLANVAYAISIKRLSLLMSVGYGWIFFRERDIHIRLLSTLCMFFGVILVVMS